MNSAEVPVSMTIQCNGGVRIENYPLKLSFCNRLIFEMLPCYTVDESIVPDIKEIKSISISDRSGVYIVGLMDNWNREKEFFYIGQTTLSSYKNSITIGKLLPLKEFTDIVFVPVKVFYELAMNKKSSVFLIHSTDFPDETIPQKIGNIVNVYGFKQSTIDKKDLPISLYFNESRWDEFFSKEFRDLVSMEVIGIPQSCFQKVVYFGEYGQAETVQFVLPSFRTVKNELNMFLCKYIYTSLFGEVDDEEEPEAVLSDDFDDDQGEEIIVCDDIDYRATSKRKQSRVPKTIVTAVLAGYGWIHIVRTIQK